MRVDVRIPATDGHLLAATLHQPVGRPRAVVLAPCAMGVARRFYGAFADHLAERGFLAVTFDYRGIGESGPAPRARALDWGEKDLAGILAWAAKEHAGLPRLVAGHSIGAQLVGLAEGAEDLAGVVAVGATAPYWRSYPWPDSWRRLVEFGVVVPTVATAFGRLPRFALGQEVPRDAALEWARWARHPDYLLREGGAARRAKYQALGVPMLFVGIDDDDYAPPRAIDGLMRLYAGAKKERRQVHPSEYGLDKLGHFGCYRKGVGEPLWREIVAWLDARVRS